MKLLKASWRKTFVIVVTLMILTSGVTYLYASSGLSSIIAPGSLYKAANYIILSPDGNLFYGLNGKTGNLDYSSANLSFVIASTIGALGTEGGTIAFQLPSPVGGAYTCNIRINKAHVKLINITPQGWSCIGNVAITAAYSEIDGFKIGGSGALLNFLINNQFGIFQNNLFFNLNFDIFSNNSADVYELFFQQNVIQNSKVIIQSGNNHAVTDLHWIRNWLINSNFTFNSVSGSTGAAARRFIDNYFESSNSGDYSLNFTASGNDAVIGNHFDQPITTHAIWLSSTVIGFVARDNTFTHANNNTVYIKEGALNVSIIGNPGLNPIGQLNNAWNYPQVGLVAGGKSTPTFSATFRVTGDDILLTCTGGNGFALKDYAGNQYASGLTAVTDLYIPQGFQIAVGSSAPTCTVDGL
jgi:hypothetical protein